MSIVYNHSDFGKSFKIVITEEPDKKIKDKFLKLLVGTKFSNLHPVMLENPKVARDLIYDYRGMKIKAFRNEAGWNSVYVAGKIIKKIGLRILKIYTRVWC